MPDGVLEEAIRWHSEAGVVEVSGDTKRRRRGSAYNRDETEPGVAPLHNTAHGLTSLVGPWPPGVSPERFTPTNWSDTIRKVKSFREGMYPCKAFSDVKPEYVVLDDGRIGRKSNRYSDLLICGVLPSHHRAAAEPHVLMWRLIEHYSQWPLAQFVFLLPEFERVSQAAASDRTPYIVAEHVKIHVYTGVENALFAAYEALPEGGLLSDASIERELRTLIS